MTNTTTTENIKTGTRVQLHNLHDNTVRVITATSDPYPSADVTWHLEFTADDGHRYSARATDRWEIPA